MIFEIERLKYHCTEAPTDIQAALDYGIHLHLTVDNQHTIRIIRSGIGKVLNGHVIHRMKISNRSFTRFSKNRACTTHLDRQVQTIVPDRKLLSEHQSHKTMQELDLLGRTPNNYKLCNPKQNIPSRTDPATKQEIFATLAMN